jgi:hypothetical protein
MKQAHAEKEQAEQPGNPLWMVVGATAYLFVMLALMVESR